MFVRSSGDIAHICARYCRTALNREVFDSTLIADQINSRTKIMGHEAKRVGHMYLARGIARGTAILYSLA